MGRSDSRRNSDTRPEAGKTLYFPNYFIAEVIRRYLPLVCGLEILLSWTQSAHKSQKVEEIINSCHAELRFHPPYSPELNYREDVE